MAATLLTMNSAVLFIGDASPDKAEFLTISTVKIPALEETTKEHLGGGAMAGIDLGMRVIKAPMLGFKLHGFNPDVMDKFMPGTPGRIKYTVRGNVRDAREHTDLEIKAIIEGRMSKYEPSDFKRDDGMDSDYEIKEVTFYQLYFDGAEKFYFDYFSGPMGFRVNGVAPHTAMARNLGLA